MSQDIGRHEPTPEFRAHLEWQIRSALRRETRFTAPVLRGPAKRWRRLRAAVVILAAIGIGGIGGVASAQVQDARQRDLLLANARAELQLAQVRLELAQADYDRARQRFDSGLIGRETLLQTEAQMQSMRSALDRIRIDIEEIEATASTPRNELTAPVVGDRDFVRERIRNQLENAQHELAAAERAVQAAQGRYRLGVVPVAAVFQAEVELVRARNQLEMLTARLDYRERFLRGELSAEQLAPALRQRELRLDLEQAQQALQLVRQRVDDLRKRSAIGAVDELDLKRAEVELLERELALQQLRRELEMLEAGGRTEG